MHRMDGDGPCDSGSKKANGGTGGDYRYYASSISTSGGLHWSAPRPMHGAGCVRPKLLSLGPSAPVLLSGGRLCVENTTDVDVWVSEDGMAKPAAWTKHSVSYWHNLLWQGNASDRFYTKWINNSAVWERLAVGKPSPAQPASPAYLPALVCALDGLACCCSTPRSFPPAHGQPTLSTRSTVCTTHSRMVVGAPTLSRS